MVEGCRHLEGFLSLSEQENLLSDLRDAAKTAPYFRPVMPRSGRPFSVEMTNCGSLGWVSDKVKGYRYQDVHPETGQPWPEIPQQLLDLWRAVADYPGMPEACLVNYYADGAKMGSHVDRDEEERDAPVVSVSLGDEAVFHVGGLKRGGTKTRYNLKSGDVFVLGGSARFAYHGIDRVISGSSSLLPEGGRINITMRRVRPLE
ncbi:MAG: alpha-ketoglutarate-dependent dioxygenase AlkB [Filomicrobium sp.]